MFCARVHRGRRSTPSSAQPDGSRRRSPSAVPASGVSSELPCRSSARSAATHVKRHRWRRTLGRRQAAFRHHRGDGGFAALHAAPTTRPERPPLPTYRCWVPPARRSRGGQWARRLGFRWRRVLQEPTPLQAPTHMQTSARGRPAGPCRHDHDQPQRCRWTQAVPDQRHRNRTHVSK
jgi:hypothetical protein